MKKFLSFLLAIALCLPLLACAKESVRIQEPVSFYYRRRELAYGEENSVILSENREAAGYSSAPDHLLKEYLAGPISEDLTQTFPYGTTLIHYTADSTKATITVSSHLANLSGMDLTIACACLTLTVMELLDVEIVEIRAKDALLNDAESIILDRESLLFLDDSATKPAD